MPPIRLNNRSGLYRAVIRPLLFRLSPEAAHELSVEACRLAACLPGMPSLMRSLFEFDDAVLQTTVAGLQFDNPIGLAAGWDKSARALTIIDALGFGFAEIGSVSARPSKGNPKPRLFRLPQDQAIIVNYGLPNDGAEAVSVRVARHRGRHPVGVNIVKTNDGPDAAACDDNDILNDYVQSISRLHRHAGYLMLNLSCPNARGGKDFFAQRGNICRLLERLRPLSIQCPVFLKVAPNDDARSHEQLLCETEGFEFVRGFSFNLPPGKPETLTLSTSRASLGPFPGAVAGRPVATLINRCISGLYERMDRRRYAIIGAGGVFNANDAYEKIRLGASLIQVYTALVYEGPGVVKHICYDLAELLRRDGFTHVGEAVGSAHPA